MHTVDRDRPELGVLSFFGSASSAERCAQIYKHSRRLRWFPPTTPPFQSLLNKSPRVWITVLYRFWCTIPLLRSLDYSTASSGLLHYTTTPESGLFCVCVCVCVVRPISEGHASSQDSNSLSPYNLIPLVYL